MRTIKKKPLIIIAVVAAVILIFVLLTTVGRPLFSKSITAKKLDDLKNVCYNNKIVNAAAYTSPKEAVVAAFYEQAYSDENPWNNVSGTTDAYFAPYADYTKTTVVACFEHQPFEAKQIATCDDIKLMSATYKTIFYEAKTGKKISEGKTIINDDPTCPSYVVYDTLSKETAKAPDHTEMIEAIEAFVGK